MTAGLTVLSTISMHVCRQRDDSGTRIGSGIHFLNRSVAATDDHTPLLPKAAPVFPKDPLL